MASSTVPTVKANLVEQLQGRNGLTGVQVTNGPPLPATSREYIWVGDAEGTQELGAMAAPNQRHEVYDVQVVVNVLKEGTDTAAADSRCFDLSAELEAQLRSDPTVLGAVNLAYPATFKLTEFVSPDGANRIAQLIVGVNCQQWI